MSNPEFSIIIPIYNAEKYLQETVRCILDQDFGFTEHAELILVNDGSTDRSEDICLFFQKEYPGNITYIKKENGGVSSARNLGIDAARGELLWFLDGDDLLSSNALSAVNSFFSNCKNQATPFVCLRTILLYKLEKTHPLDFRFQKGERLIDLVQEPQCAATMIGDKCFRRKAVGDIRFDENIRINEDTHFSYRILLNTDLTYGVIPEAIYYYRKHEDSTTAPQGSEHSEEFLRCQFESMAKLVYLYRQRTSEGPVEHFIQYTILYLMTTKRYRQLKLKNPETNRLVLRLISECEDSVIGAARRFSPEQKMFLFDLKYGGEEWQKNWRLEGDELWLEDSRIAKISTWLKLTLLKIKEQPNRDLELTLQLPAMNYQTMGFGEIYFTYDGKKLPVSTQEAPEDMKVQLFGRAGKTPIICKVILSKKKISANPGVRFKAKIRFITLSGEQQTLELSINRNQRTTNLPYGGPLPWISTGHYIIKAYKRDLGYVVLKQTYQKLKKANTNFMNKTRDKWNPQKFYSLYDVFKAEQDIGKRITEMALARLGIIKHKKIWIIHDQLNLGSGNGEELYRYLMAHHSKEIKPYFALYKEECGAITAEWERLEDEDFNLVDYGSREHMNLLVRAQVVTSSDLNELFDGSVAKLWPLYASLFRFEHVFIGDLPDFRDKGSWSDSEMLSVSEGVSGI